MTVHTPIKKQEVTRIPNSSNIKSEDAPEEAVPAPAESTEPAEAEPTTE